MERARMDARERWRRVVGPNRGFAPPTKIVGPIRGCLWHGRAKATSMVVAMDTTLVDSPSYDAAATHQENGWQVRVARFDLTAWTHSMDEIEDAARAAIADHLGLPLSAVSVDVTIHLPDDISDDLAEVTRWRDISTYAANRVAMLTRRVADQLVTREHLTQRECAGLLGVSQQRIAQLLKKPE